MHALSLNSKFLIEWNTDFPYFFGNQNWQVKPSCPRPPQTAKSAKERFKNFFNFTLKCNRSYRKKFVVEGKRWRFIWLKASGPFCPPNFHVYVEWKSICYWYLSKWKAKLFITFAIAWVASSLVPLRAAIDWQPWFSGTIELGFVNSIDQLERA